MADLIVPVLRDVASLRQQVAQWHSERLRVAVVPTMGALHDGHLSLVRRGFEKADRVIATIFINPKQFAAHEDLGTYPRDEAGDLAKLASVGCSLVYAPTLEMIYPFDFATTIHVEGPAKVGLEDAFRPQFFDGVTTVVAILFAQTGADYGIFGEKDYQQLQVIRCMVSNLHLPIEIVSVPTMREADGLAMSSRNAYLLPQQRQQAPELFRTLTIIAEAMRAGTHPYKLVQERIVSLTAHGFKVDYLEVRNSYSLVAPDRPWESFRLLAAAWLGKTRLIDNIAV